MTKAREIVAYLYKDEWYKAAEVQQKRAIDGGAFRDALPYTVVALRHRRDYGRDVPSWVDLDKHGGQR